MWRAGDYCCRSFLCCIPYVPLPPPTPPVAIDLSFKRNVQACRIMACEIEPAALRVQTPPCSLCLVGRQFHTRIRDDLSFEYTAVHQQRLQPSHQPIPYGRVYHFIYMKVVGSGGVPYRGDIVERWNMHSTGLGWDLGMWVWGYVGFVVKSHYST